MGAQQSQSSTELAGCLAGFVGLMVCLWKECVSQVVVSKTLQHKLAFGEHRKQLRFLGIDRTQGPIGSTTASNPLTDRVQKVAGGGGGPPHPPPPPITPPITASTFLPPPGNN